MQSGTPTLSKGAEGNMDQDVNASFGSVLRSRRPQSTSGNFMHENRETSETPVSRAGSRPAGEGHGRTTRMNVWEESDRGIVPMNYWNQRKPRTGKVGREGLLIKENTQNPAVPDSVREPCVYGDKGVRSNWPSQSAIRAVCAKPKFH